MMMTEKEKNFFKIAEALLVDYSSIYYVNAVTNEYYWYSVNAEFHSLQLEQGGDDFFKNIVRDCKKVVYEEDQHIFIEDIQKERLMNAMKKGTMQNIEYRLMIDGVPTWHSLRLIRGMDEDYFVLGVTNIDKEYHQRENAKELERQKNIYNQVTSSLAEQYDTLYYIDVETGTYTDLSSTDEYKKLNVPATGKDFFAESRRSIKMYVHPEDQEKVMRLHYKDNMLENLKDRSSFSLAYRLVVDGVVQNIRHTEIITRDRKHIVVCVENIDSEVQAKQRQKETQERSVIYSQIAESLASHYDLIYYIDSETSYYMEFSSEKLYGELEISKEGEDFFSTSRENAYKVLYSDDRDRMKLFLDRDNFISQLDNRRQLVEEYRMAINNENPKYTRMTVMWSYDRSHFIVCIENIDADVKKEEEHIKALTRANELARRDALTGTKNKTAYDEVVEDIQSRMDHGRCDPFGIAVCDINELKIINDNEGHKAGDEYIRSSCRLICEVFRHSPVFRIGGDEFAVLLTDRDLKNSANLISKLKKQVEEYIVIGEGPVVAFGFSEYDPDSDKRLEEVFERADQNMYEDKSRLKEEKFLHESRALKERASFSMITDERRSALDNLYNAFEVVNSESYIYLCDMKFDFSRWSKAAVDRYGLPSEYMYGAGDIWENHIHPEDREAYHIGIDEVFSGIAGGHDMQYRASRTDGKYDVCTCRGTVIKDNAGEPDYFAGVINNHSEQGHIDSLTGLRNQYGFFEDLDGAIRRNSKVTVVMLGISRFTEINEMYGYHFGNRVLQRFSRKLYETVGNTGHIYRLDGTKFAIISNDVEILLIQNRYKEFVRYFRREFFLDDKNIMLEINCGLVKLDHYDIDAQTIYSCLNFTYVESKTRRHGELVVFHDDLNEDNRQRLEQIHVIRNSIMKDYRGFYLMYQPVVDAKTEQVIGSEALLRWKNDTYGIVPPDRFIPLLESDPLFPQLGAWILREAVLTAKKIIKKVPDFLMNVNLSYAQLEKSDFADMVVGILDELDYPADHLCLEVTERCRLLDLDLLKNVIANLKARGVLIALDDFGTGFSSVDIVKELPFDIIKIDRSFVQKIEENDAERELIKHFANIASVFGAKVCVEGIETEGMKEILKNFHVESFQGYYYAKPLLPEEFLDRLT